ncbi:quercetin dioxygenase-like cupin family protein [Hydrogenophaga palleronii]|uniref:Quercetin dioxygenase-like cupin family protein n=1 Tax=Hydrogenophaga palleronii TaxID=65655 RepID=A0ABU1WKW1_9BURK|nr:cupin domain-containing protein [Hydrogenophaga palleronii]MDR7149921.1 quercetin dioxygenase-like cupin family protein [Hydrogenophaga palleronii]
MALNHLQPGEIANLRPTGADAVSSQSVALFKSEQLEVIRLVLPAGRAMPMHAVPGEITVQCLEGSIDFETPSGTQRLRAGQLVFLKGGEPHALTGVEEATVLVTIVLRP